MIMQIFIMMKGLMAKEFNPNDLLEWYINVYDFIYCLWFYTTPQKCVNYRTNVKCIDIILNKLDINIENNALNSLKLKKIGKNGRMKQELHCDKVPMLWLRYQNFKIATSRGKGRSVRDFIYVRETIMKWLCWNNEKWKM